MAEEKKSETELTPRESWNNIYAEKEQRWSGKPNATLVDLLQDFKREGRALDLGCGEGGDVIWLAQQGWEAYGVDISDVAIERARKAAEAAGVEAYFTAQDLEDWKPQQKFSLIVSSFMQSHFADLDRVKIFKKALNLLEVGGYLVSVSHAGFPSFIAADDPRHQLVHRLPDPKLEGTALTAGSKNFELLQASRIERQVSSPEGEQGTIDDGVLVIRRIA